MHARKIPIIWRSLTLGGQDLPRLAGKLNPKDLTSTPENLNSVPEFAGMEKVWNFLTHPARSARCGQVLGPHG